MKKIILLLVILCLKQSIIAQNPKIDSLRIILSTRGVADTTKLKALNVISWEYALVGDYKTGIQSANDALAIANTVAVSRLILDQKADAYVNIGIINYYKSDYNRALEFYLRALPILEEIKDRKGMSSVYNNIGMVYDDKGEYTKALEFLLKSLKIREELGDKQGISASYGNIGGIHYSKGDYAKALDFHLKAVEIRKEIGNKKGLASSYNNIGIIYDDKGDYLKALEYQEKSLEIKEKIGDKKGMALSYGNMGNTFKHMGDHRKALEYFLKSLKLKEELEDKRGMASTYHNIGLLYLVMGRLPESKLYQQKGLFIAREIDARPDILKSYEGLSKVDSALGNYKDAYEHHKKFTMIKDSIFNEEANKKVVQSEMNFEFEKKEQAAKLEQEKKDALASEALKKQKMQRNGFIGGFALMLALAGVSYRGYRNKRKAHRMIALQKMLVEEKQKEIVDSIQYAKRIQYALLAHDEFLSANLSKYFVLFKPKDIVSGDFYWSARKGNDFYFAVCDSTGHGVPGAFMSLLNISFLNEAINEKNITEPHLILNHVRSRLIESVSQEGAQDGMDAVLLRFNKTTGSCVYAAANNAPVLVRNGELNMQGYDKMPVGKGERSDSFTLRNLDIQRDDVLYVYTDGFADQFGGPKGKKFKYRQLNELLLSVHKDGPEKQQDILEISFNSWKGGLEQVDDVCIAGIIF